MPESIVHGWQTSNYDKLVVNWKLHVHVTGFLHPCRNDDVLVNIRLANALRLFQQGFDFLVQFSIFRRSWGSKGCDYVTLCVNQIFIEIPFWRGIRTFGKFLKKSIGISTAHRASFEHGESHAIVLVAHLRGFLFVGELLMEIGRRKP